MKTTWTGINIPIVNGFLKHAMAGKTGETIVGIVNKTHLKVSRIGGITAKVLMLMKSGFVPMTSVRVQIMNSLQIILITKRVEGQNTETMKMILHVLMES